MITKKMCELFLENINRQKNIMNGYSISELANSQRSANNLTIFNLPETNETGRTRNIKL